MPDYLIFRRKNSYHVGTAAKEFEVVSAAHAKSDDAARGLVRVGEMLARVILPERYREDGREDEAREHRRLRRLQRQQQRVAKEPIHA